MSQDENWYSWYWYSCHHVQPEQGWWGSSWSIWPSSGHGGDVGPLEMVQREHEEG